MTTQKVHDWRWLKAKYEITCGVPGGLINRIEGRKAVTCKRCLKIIKARGWKL